MELCKKHTKTGTFWCRLNDGHPGLCENGIGYTNEPYRGTLAEMLDDIERLTARIVENSKKDHGRKSSKWQDTANWSRHMAGAIEDRLRWYKSQ